MYLRIYKLLNNAKVNKGKGLIQVSCVMVLTLLKYENYTAHQSRVYLALAKRTSLQCSLQLVFVLQNGNGEFRYLITK